MLDSSAFGLAPSELLDESSSMRLDDVVVAVVELVDGTRTLLAVRMSVSVNDSSDFNRLCS